MEVIISYSLTHCSVVETFSFLQLLQANIWACGGFGVKWLEPPLLGGTEEKRLRLLSLTDFNTKCLVRYNQRLARALLPSLALSLKHITKLMPCALQM